MRGRPKPRPVDEILTEVWQVVEELEGLTEGLEQALVAAGKRVTDRGSDDR